MTDNEIIKALECCRKGKCRECCMDEEYLSINECTAELAKEALDLIQRQQERIERQKGNLDAVLKEREDYTEAIKEFADRIVEQLESERRFYNSASEHDQLIRQGVSIAFEIVKGVQNE